jgi:hypothetical protein
MPSTTPYLHRHTRTSIRNDAPTEKWWQKHEADLVVKCVCETCNSGWMNDIDQAAKPFATQMALGHDTVLGTVAGHVAVATWMTKVALMFDQAQARPLVEPEDHHRFYATRRPLPASIVWLARALPPKNMFSAGGRPYGLRLDPAGPTEPQEADSANLYFCTVDINHLLFQVYIPRRNTPAGIPHVRSSEARFVRKLWPATFTKIVWPPEGAVPHDKLDTFASVFITD